MTFREANNMIDDISWFYGGESITTDDIVECREICHKALEKQMPKKPLQACGHRTDRTMNYCPMCGQALDWSGTE